MELVAPAGNAEKLAYAWEYGADAAYVGLKRFSLRAKADNFHGEEYLAVRALKDEYAARGKPKRLFCALNIAFHDREIDALRAELDYFRQYPLDAFIIQDLGLLPLLAREFPEVSLHLSTQANCINSEAAKFYRSLGFKRVVLGRETGLDEIRRIKDAAPELELEAFAHGAMCIAYSGRCLMSAYLSGRSANSGSCSHTCRWDWRAALSGEGEAELAVEERARPGEYYPVIEGDDFTALFSSKDLCMIDYLSEMKRAGVDSLKIEGRMKSIHYAAVVTRAYRKRLDAMEGRIPPGSDGPFVAEIEKVAHRKFTTGFYLSPETANETTRGETFSPWLLAGTLGPELTGPATPEGFRDFEFYAMNRFDAGDPLEYIGPDDASVRDGDYRLVNPETGEERAWVSHHHPCVLRTRVAAAPRWIARVADPGKREAGLAAATSATRVPRSLR